jgi:hypothetical protein
VIITQHLNDGAEKLMFPDPFRAVRGTDTLDTPVSGPNHEGHEITAQSRRPRRKIIFKKSSRPYP